MKKRQSKTCPRPPCPPARRVRSNRTLGDLVHGDESKRAADEARLLSKQLTSAGIRHAVIGGLAVRAHGYKRSTDDADLIVLSEGEGFFEGRPLSVVPGVSFTSHGVGVEALYPDENEGFLTKAVEAAEERAAVKGAVPVIGLPALIYLKLKAARSKDNADVVELIRRAKPDIAKIQRYLDKHAPHLAEDFPSLVAEAEAQRDAGPQ